MSHHKTTSAVDKYILTDLNDEVKLNLPDDWKCRVIKVESGASGNVYYVYVLAKKDFQWSWLEPSNLRRREAIVFCNCSNGYHKSVLTALGLDIRCRHMEGALEILRTKKWTEK